MHLPDFVSHSQDFGEGFNLYAYGNRSQNSADVFTSLGIRAQPLARLLPTVSSLLGTDVARPTAKRYSDHAGVRHQSMIHKLKCACTPRGQ